MKKKIILGTSGVVGALLLSAGLVFALVGDLLDTVGLPGNGDCSVAGTFTGTYYMTMEGGFAVGCAGSTLQIYTPPTPDVLPGLPPDPATLVSTKTIVDAADGVTPVAISALAWDPTRSKLWGAYDDDVWLIDVGDPTLVGTALATFKFSASAKAPGEVGPDILGDLPGITLVDGLAYDGNNDSIWYSPDIHCHAYNFAAADGTYLGKVTPKNAAGAEDCSVSGVVVGSGNTLYIGRDGFSEIRRVDKTTGAFVSSFATTTGRVEDLTCDPVTYAPKEAILAKDAYGGPAGDPANTPLYEAFEVEPGTCPLPEPPDETPPKAACTESVNPHGAKIPPAGKSTPPGTNPNSGVNEDGYYHLGATDDSGLPVAIFVTNLLGTFTAGPYPSSTTVKITEAPGATPNSKPMGSSSGAAGAVAAHITLDSDALVFGVDAAGNVSAPVTCLVPPPPK